MTTDQDKRDTLNHILGSKAFSKSTTSNVLLKYLVEMSVEGVDITASDISHELFGSKYEQEKSEATVRVNIYHLRKKLDKYYDEEGKNDTIRISIDRGQYQVSFVENKETKGVNLKYVVLLVVVVVFVVAFIFYGVTGKRKEKVWADSFANSHPTTLYLSAVFGYSAVGPFGNRVFQRDVLINSQEELDKAIAANPGENKKIEAARYNYITFEDGATINHFSRLFTKNDKEFVVRRADEFLFNDIKEQNIIYLSPMRYWTGFSGVFNELSNNLKFKLNPNKRVGLHYSKGELNADSIIAIRSDGNSEYAIAAKFRTSTNTCQYMFFADHGLGLTAMAEYFTNKDSIVSFSNKYLQNTGEFVALFYVHGKERTNLGLELLLFDDNK